MLTAIPCPDPTQYQRLASGELLSGEKDALLDHLESCDACVTSVEGLAENDRLVELIRQASQLGPLEHEAVDGLAERFSKLRPDLEILAAAYAEIGNFKEAIRCRKKALEVGFGDESDPKQVEKAPLRLKLNQQSRPYREE
jgi:hypothetical protein